MIEAQALRSLGARPLVVVTALKDQKPEWMGLQNDILALSTNTAHVVLPDADHDMVTANRETARQSATGIRAVVNAVRSGARLGDMG
jgi:hypothetical protein